MSTDTSVTSAIDDTRDVFISYRSSDDQLVRPVVDGLERAGLTCWFAPNDLQPFDSALTQKIRNGILASRATLAFISNDYQTSNACKWEMIQSIAYGGLDSLLHVRMPGSNVVWSAVQEENYFADLPSTENELGGLVTNLKDRVDGLPIRSSSIDTKDVWWETRWTGSATGMFSERLQLLRMLTEHLGREGADAGPPEVAQIVGFGGTGKSMLALQFAKDFELLFNGGIVRINAGADARGDDLDDRVDAMQDILRQLIEWIQHWQSTHATLRQPAPDPKDPHAWVKARSCVAEILERGGDGTLLWIIDDLPQGLTAADVDRLCCPSPGCTLFTTRTETYTQLRPLPLYGMARDDAVMLLSNGHERLRTESAEVLGQIADEVGCHALTLAMLAPMVTANSPHRILDRIRQPHPRAAQYLERAADAGMVLPTDHASTILGTISSSILGIESVEARTILRLASLWPKGQEMERPMLDQVIGDDLDHVYTQLSERHRLATTDSDKSVTVHAMVSTVTGWLVEDGALRPDDGQPDDVELRLAAAAFEGQRIPKVTPKDVWLESDAGQVVWHLLEPIAAELDDEYRELAARALLAMARVPMRHKPAGLTQPELVEILTVAEGWAEEAQQLCEGMTATDSTADKAMAMRGLLRLDLAEIRTGQEAIDECEEGTRQLLEVVALRQAAAENDNGTDVRESLAKAHFNLGRLVKVAKKLEENGAGEGVDEALDDASAAYVAAGQIREEAIAAAGGEANVPAAHLENLASSYRGRAIVDLTRVCRQDGLTSDQCRQLLAEALQHLAEASRLTGTAMAKNAWDSDSAVSAEMGKDLVVVANVQLCRWLLGPSEPTAGAAAAQPPQPARTSADTARSHTLDAATLERRWREAERDVAAAVDPTTASGIAGKTVDWLAAMPAEANDPLAAARVALARLTVNQARGGRHPSGSVVLKQFNNDDLPALQRRAASGIMAS